jgi:hypothetical protein
MPILRGQNTCSRDSLIYLRPGGQFTALRPTKEMSCNCSARASIPRWALISCIRVIGALALW